MKLEGIQALHRLEKPTLITQTDAGVWLQGRRDPYVWALFFDQKGAVAHRTRLDSGTPVGERYWAAVCWQAGEVDGVILDIETGPGARSC